MAKTTTADAMVGILIEWGVEVIFGLPGDGINGIMEALRKRQDKIKFVHVRHEESAAFMACGYAKYTGKLGVCLATTGPGGIHLLNGLYDAKCDGAPVLAITGLSFHDLINTHGQQDIELDKLFENVCVYNNRVMGPAHIENVTELACRTALAYKGVSHVTIPVDFQSQEATRKHASERNPAHHVSNVMANSSPPPRASELMRAADLLNEGREIAIMAGQGALGAGDELLEIAEILGAPIVKPLLGKAVVPDESIYTTGGIGLLGTLPSEEALEQCDTLLMAGTSFPYMEFLPKPGQARAVQIDHNASRIGLRYPVEVGLVGDSRVSLRALIPLLHRNDHRQFLTRAQDGMKKWWSQMKEQGTRMSKPMKPQVVAWELGKRISDDAIVSCDCGEHTTFWARLIPARQGQLYSVSGTLATMACGLPYAIAAQVAYPGRQSIAFVGDGGFSMLMADFSTCVKYKLPVKVVLLKNNTLGQIKWEQIVMLGNPEYGCEFEPIDFANFAKDCGGSGYRIEDPTNCGEILEAALRDPKPAIIEAIIDPYEPPMPAKIKPEQTVKFAESLARGERDRGKIISTIARDKFRELI